MLSLAPKYAKPKRAEFVSQESNWEILITETFLHEVNKWKSFGLYLYFFMHFSY